ncbi:C40 family peptidase [Arthrobacter mangrovi]|uniref:C40 family peptidase n=1 Tax=Arthrobacter mangrovi TaxID=2966350 RepID=UPI0022308A79|nr:NlpC/P60 family protein [Arthrobacter mangrovi]
MSKNTSVTGRHRAVPVRTSPLETISKAVSSNAGSVGRQAAVIAAASGLVLTVGVPAQATAIQRDASVQAAASAPSRIQVEAVQASSTADLEFDRPSISSTPAPVEEPEPVVEAVAEEVAPAEEAPAAEAPAAEAPAASAPKEEEKAAKADVAASGIGAALVASAYSQIGVSQDCTALVENALRSAGISVGDLAPAQFFAYGTQVSTPQPGDMIYYDDAGAGVPHIAIYVGNGQAIHGGWTGYTTTLADAYIGSGPVFIRPSA